MKNNWCGGMDTKKFNEMRLSIKKCKSLVCPVCKKTYNTRKYLLSHFKLHGPRNNVICPICGKTFACRKYMVNHNNRVHTSTERNTCPVCNKVFISVREMTKHWNLEHKAKMSFTCRICGKIFTAERYLKRHLWQIHESVKGQVQCTVCHLKFKFRRDIKQHCLKLHDGKGFTDISCGTAEKLENTSIDEELENTSIDEELENTSIDKELENTSIDKEPENTSIDEEPENTSTKLPDEDHDVCNNLSARIVTRFPEETPLYISKLISRGIQDNIYRRVSFENEGNVGTRIAKTNQEHCRNVKRKNKNSRSNPSEENLNLCGSPARKNNDNGSNPSEKNQKLCGNPARKNNECGTNTVKKNPKLCSNLYKKYQDSSAKHSEENQKISRNPTKTALDSGTNSYICQQNKNHIQAEIDSCKKVNIAGKQNMKPCKVFLKKLPLEKDTFHISNFNVRKTNKDVSKNENAKSYSSGQLTSAVNGEGNQDIDKSNQNLRLSNKDNSVHNQDNRVHSQNNSFSSQKLTVTHENDTESLFFPSAHDEVNFGVKNISAQTSHKLEEYIQQSKSGQILGTKENNILPSSQQRRLTSLDKAKTKPDILEKGRKIEGRMLIEDLKSPVATEPEEAERIHPEKSDNFISGRSICTVNSQDNNNETLRGSEDPELDAAPALTVEKEEEESLTVIVSDSEPASPSSIIDLTSEPELDLSNKGRESENSRQKTVVFQPCEEEVSPRTSAKRKRSVEIYCESLINPWDTLLQQLKLAKDNQDVKLAFNLLDEVTQENMFNDEVCNRFIQLCEKRPDYYWQYLWKLFEMIQKSPGNLLTDDSVTVFLRSFSYLPDLSYVWQVIIHVMVSTTISIPPHMEQQVLHSSLQNVEPYYTYIEKWVLMCDQLSLRQMDFNLQTRLLDLFKSKRHFAYVRKLEDATRNIKDELL